MARNNMDRLGIGKDRKGEDSPPPDIPQFSFIAPTEMVDLPSEGKFYKEGHPLHGQAQIEIRFMTAKEEDILLNESYIKNAIVLDKLLQSLIINKKVHVNDLLVGDKNALIVASRITGYGAEYETRVSCPKCGTAGKFTFDLNDADVYAGEVDESEVTPTDDPDVFSVVTPLSKLPVEIRLMTGADEKSLAQMFQGKNKKKMQNKLMTAQLKRLVVSVDGHDHPQMVSTFAEGCPARVSRYIRQMIKKITPNIDLTQDYECDSCSHFERMEVPFNGDFFWPDR